MNKQLIINVIDSLCLTCAKRLLHIELFTATKSTAESNYNWIVDYLNEKKAKEQNELLGCGICFGILEKYSQKAYLQELAEDINTSGIQFKDFRISLTAPNLIALRERFIELVLNSIPNDELSLRLFNPNYLTVKEQWKILTFHPLELIMGKPYNHSSLFDAKVRFTIQELECDWKLLESKVVHLNEGKQKRLSRKAKKQKEEQEKGFTKPNVDQLIKELNLDKFKKFYELPFERLLCTTETECFHDPIFLAGRYLKNSRTLSQTAWIVDGQRKMVSSIEEIMGDVLKKELGAIEAVFTASGREDIDVKCLGNGRPFVLEFFQPKKTQFSRAELNHYQKLINESTKEMSIKDLQYVSRDQTKLIREGQEDKTKCYRALCYCYSKLNSVDIDILNNMNKVDILQKTPVRVLHRRTVMTRPRSVTDIKAELIDEHHFKINMTTQAGTYVKEFVHGDLGRTEPSLCTILNKECDILELDVEAVNLDFPPEIKSDEV